MESRSSSFSYTCQEGTETPLHERLDRPEKNWKFSTADVGEREHWDNYQDAYET